MTRKLAPLLVVALLVLTACGGSGTTSAKPAAKGDGMRYVAIGDSYTAAPYVPMTDLAGGCFRSDHNYPHLVAGMLKVGKLVDVSCGGATNSDLVGSQTTLNHAQVPPQIKALTKDTDLVTVSLGGNDGGLFTDLLLTLCRGVPGATCPSSSSKPINELLGQLRPSLVRTLTAVRKAAPRAQVLLVGYPKFAPDSSGCARLPKIEKATLDGARQANLGLQQEMKAAAKQVGIPFIDVYKASIGHDICSATPWVNGSKNDPQAAAAFHPFAREQVAVAKLIAKAVKR